LDRVLLQSSFI